MTQLTVEELLAVGEVALADGFEKWEERSGVHPDVMRGCIDAAITQTYLKMAMGLSIAECVADVVYNTMQLGWYVRHCHEPPAESEES